MKRTGALLIGPEQKKCKLAEEELQLTARQEREILFKSFLIIQGFENSLSYDYIDLLRQDLINNHTNHSDPIAIVLRQCHTLAMSRQCIPMKVINEDGTIGFE